VIRLPLRPGQQVSVRGAASLLCLLSSVPLSAQQVDHPADGLPNPRSRLTPAEADRAVRVATGGAVTSWSPTSAAPSSFARAPAAGGTVVSSVRMTVGRKDEPDSLFAVVTTYSYGTHRTTRRLIDLRRESIVWERSAADGRAPLAPVEEATAKRLALEDPRVRGLLGSSIGVVVLEILHPIIGDTGHPLFGKRVALVLFKAGHDYLAGLPAVFANLTDADIFIEE